MKKSKLFLALSSFLSIGMTSCGEPSTFKVSFSTGVGYTIIGEEKANKDSSYSFSIKFSEGYEASPTFKVDVNGEVVTGNEYSYTVENVSSDLNIEVSGVSKISFDVSFVAAEGVTFNGLNKVDYGATYTFTASKKEGYEGDLAIFYAIGEDSNKTIAGENGEYSISEVKGNLTISANPLDLIEYNVNTPSKNDAYTFQGESKVKYGQDYTFELKENIGFQFSSISAKENNEPKLVEPIGNDTYKVSNVKGELTIIVNDPDVKYFSINKDFDSTHFDFVGDEKAAYGSDYVFELNLKEGFSEGENFVFLVNDDTPSKNEDGKYVVRNVTAPIHIEAFGEEEVKLNVSFSSDVEGAISNVAEQIPYFSPTYSFVLNFSSKYSQCEDEVQVYLSNDGEETLLVKGEDGSYTLNNPHKDFQILVKGCRLNRYTISFYNGDERVYEATLNDGTKLTSDQLFEAETALKSRLNENEQFEGWKDFDIDSLITKDLKVESLISTGISTLVELKGMEENGVYHLTNDIELSSKLDIENFSGYLNGNGHKLIGLGAINGSSASALFKNFSGTLKNIYVDFSIIAYRDFGAGLISNMTGGFLDNIDANLSFIGETYPGGFDGGLVNKLIDGTISNSKIHFSSATLNSSTDLVGAVVGSLEGGKVDNITILTPKGMDNANLSIAFKTNEGLETSISNCSVITEKSHLLYDNSLAEGTKTDSTYMGMPVYSKSAKTENDQGSVSLFSSTCNVKLMKRSLFYIRSSVSFHLDGGNLAINPNSWYKVEVTYLSANSYLFKVSNNQTCFASIRKADLSYQNPDLLNSMIGFYPWAIVDATIECTPIYSEIADLSLTGVKIADALFNGGELQNDYAQPVYYHSLNAGVNTIVNDADISKYSTITFGLKSNTDASYLSDFYNDSSRASGYDINATGWAIIRATKNSSNKWDVRLYRFDSMSSDRTADYKELKDQDGTKLNDLFPAISTWVGTGIYSTSIYAK